MKFKIIKEQNFVHLLAWVYNDIPDNGVYFGERWFVMGSTDSSLGVGSLDSSITSLLKDKQAIDIETEDSWCDFFCHGDNSKSYQAHQGFEKCTCKFFFPSKCCANFTNIKYFWINENLFCLRKVNDKIYEGFQWLKLTEKEKESMLNR